MKIEAMEQHNFKIAFDYYAYLFRDVLYELVLLFHRDVPFPYFFPVQPILQMQKWANLND
jgi:hypothetical protein